MKLAPDSRVRRLHANGYRDDGPVQRAVATAPAARGGQITTADALQAVYPELGDRQTNWGAYATSGEPWSALQGRSGGVRTPQADQRYGGH